MTNMIAGIIGMSLGVVVLANVYIYVIKNTTTTGWTGAEVALWGLLTLVGIIGLVYGVLGLV
jgi:ABC-type uncharacterized transport system permease subunit